MEEEEEFLKLWFIPPSSEFVPFTQDEKKFTEESYVFRSFRSEFEVDKCYTKKCLQVVGKESNKQGYTFATRFEDFIPGYSSLSYQPKKSVLTRKEMNECYELVLLLSNYKSLNLDQQEKLNFYKERIVKEQCEYLNIAKTQWMREKYFRHMEILPEIEKFINTFWQIKLERVKSYPKFYSQSCLMNLCPTSADPIEFIFYGHIKRIGRLPRLYLPNLRFIRLNINQCLEGVSASRLEAKMERNKILENGYGYHPDVSKDQVAEEVALNNNAHVVISASAFLALIDNQPDFLNTWDLPVTVKEYNTDDGKHKKVVYIDKKFPPVSMNQNERKNLYCKLACDYSVRSMSGIKRCSKASEWDNPEEETGSGEKQLETSSELYNNRDEEFTSSDPENISIGFQPMSAEPSAYYSISDTDSDANSLIIDLDETNSESSEMKPQCGSSSRYSGLQDKDEREHFLNLNKMETTKSVNKKKHLESVTYGLWSLNKVTPSYLSKNKSKVLGIIVRCKEGHLKMKPGENGTKVRELYKVASKMEYQPEHGAEQVTLSELTRQWASLLIRPNTHLARMRVNPLDGEVIMYNKMSLNNLLCEGQRLYGVNLKDCLASFHSVMEKLTDLPAGQYFISHKPANLAFAPLFKATNGAYEVNLHTAFSVDTEEVAPERASWNPIDVNIINPTFKHFHRVPAMYTPAKMFSRTDSQVSKNPGLNKSNNKRNRRCRKNKFKSR